MYGAPQNCTSNKKDDKGMYKLICLLATMGSKM